MGTPQRITILLAVILLGIQAEVSFSEDALPATLKAGTTQTEIWAEWKSPVLGEKDTVLTPVFPDKQWWMAFGDPTLTQYIQQALKNNPTLRAALIRIAQQRALVWEQSANLFPSLKLNPSGLWAQLPEQTFLQSGSSGPSGGSLFPRNIKVYSFPFQASYELDLFGRYIDQTLAAKRQLAATEQDSLATKLSLEGEVATAYFNLLRADALVRSQEENLALLTRVSALKVSQYQMGLISLDEVIRSDRDVAQAQTNLTAFRQQQALSAHQLSVLTGSPPASEERLPRLTVEGITLPVQTNAGVPSALLSRRPDILAQEKQLERARINVRIARKAFLPTINLSAFFGFVGPEVGKVFNKSFTAFEQVGINQSLFQGGRRIAEVNLQKGRQLEQVQTYRQTILKAFQEVEDNIALLRADYENLDSNNRRLALTQHNLRLVENRYQQGLSPRLDVFQAQSEVIQYQQLEAQSKMDAAIATVNLYKALGGGF